MNINDAGTLVNLSQNCMFKSQVFFFYRIKKIFATMYVFKNALYQAFPLYDVATGVWFQSRYSSRL